MLNLILLASLAQDPAAADARFVTGMIHHHAQAIVMARWAQTHDAGHAVRTLAERIAVSQRDEIAMMQRWLRDNGRPVPEIDTTYERHAHERHAQERHAPDAHDARHAHEMPGMLSHDQLARLDSARGADFDGLFLTLMIMHHRGAVTMVEQLRSVGGSARDPIVLQIANDVVADQTAEIDRMVRLLATSPNRGRNQ